MLIFICRKYIACLIFVGKAHRQKFFTPKISQTTVALNFMVQKFHGNFENHVIVNLCNKNFVTTRSEATLTADHSKILRQNFLWLDVYSQNSRKYCVAKTWSYTIFANVQTMRLLLKSQEGWLWPWPISLFSVLNLGEQKLVDRSF